MLYIRKSSQQLIVESRRRFHRCATQSYTQTPDVRVGVGEAQLQPQMSYCQACFGY
jgi:hypothetical protein